MAMAMAWPMGYYYIMSHVTTVTSHVWRNDKEGLLICRTFTLGCELVRLMCANQGRKFQYLQVQIKFLGANNNLVEYFDRNRIILQGIKV